MDRSVDTAARARPPDAQRLVAVKAVHSAVFFLELGSILWLVATGLLNRRDRSVAIAAAAVSVEVVVWLANDRVCPLTPLAERFGADRGSVSDIWLPDRVARTIPVWSSALLLVAGLLHVRGVARRWRRAGA